MGIATYTHRKFVRANMLCGDTKSGLDLNDIAYILSSMPHGTVIESINLKPIISLSLEFEIKLYHDLFKDGAVIEDTIHYTRDIGFSESGKIIEYNKTPNLNYDDIIRKREDLDEEDKQ